MCRRNVLRLGLVAGSLVSAVSLNSGQAWAQDAFVQHLAVVEGANKLTASNSKSTAFGEYQMTEAALVQSGYATYNSPVTAANYNGNLSNLSWTGKDGATSQAAYANSAAIQTQSATDYLATTWSQEQKQGLTSYVGQTGPGGQVYNQSGLLAGGYFGGTGNLQHYLQTGTVLDPQTGLPSPSLTALMAKRISDGSQYDASDITNGQTAVAASQGTLGAGQANGGNGATITSSPVYCDPAIATVLTNSAQASVLSQVSMAQGPQTGFTLLNGNSVLQAAGLYPGASNIGGDTGDFGAFSCLSNLFNGATSLIFNPPNLDQILAGLINALCAKAHALITQATAPLQQSLFESQNMGGFFPGANLGSLGGGITTSFGNNTTSGVTVGIGGMGSSTYSFGGNPYYAPTNNYFGGGLLNTNNSNTNPQSGGLY